MSVYLYINTIRIRHIMGLSKREAFNNNYQKIKETRKNFTDFRRIGCGTYGIVYRYTNGMISKQYRNSDSYIDHTDIKELAILSNLHNVNNIVQMEAFDNQISRHTYLFLEPFETDLYNFSRKNVIKIEDYTDIIYQMIVGVANMHNLNIYHRDLKLQNILIRKKDDKFDIAICDFGMGKIKKINSYIDSGDSSEFNYSGDSGESDIVQTIIYRSPEVILSPENYKLEKIDIWSLGVCIAELFIGDHLFTNYKNPQNGYEDDTVLLNNIFEILGTPTEETWEGITKLSKYNKIKYFHTGIGLESYIPEQFIGLVKKMLTLDPNKRINIFEALDDELFKNYPKIKKNDLYDIYHIKNNNISFETTSLYFITNIDIKKLFLWLYEFCIKTNINYHIFFLSCELVKSYISLLITPEIMPIMKNNLQLIGMACLYIAYCLHNNHSISYNKYCKYTQYVYSPLQIHKMIKDVLFTLQGNIDVSTIYDYFKLKSHNIKNKIEHLLIEYLIIRINNDIYNSNEILEKLVDISYGIAKECLSESNSGYNPESNPESIRLLCGEYYELFKNIIQEHNSIYSKYDEYVNDYLKKVFFL